MFYYLQLFVALILIAAGVGIFIRTEVPNREPRLYGLGALLLGFTIFFFSFQPAWTTIVGILCALGAVAAFLMAIKQRRAQAK